VNPHWVKVDKNVFERPKPGPGEYVAHPQFVEDVRAWYFGYLPDELAGRDLPDGYHSAWKRPERDGRVVWLLRSKADDGAIEVSWRLVNGLKEDVEVRPLPPEEAYALALDADEAERARGLTVYNERHPRETT